MHNSERVSNHGDSEQKVSIERFVEQPSRLAMKQDATDETQISNANVKQTTHIIFGRTSYLRADSSHSVVRQTTQSKFHRVFLSGPSPLMAFERIL